MSRPKPLSGFPEFLPAGRIVEQRVLELLASTFELHGFGEIETRAVETLDQLTRKGEIEGGYVISRLHAERISGSRSALRSDRSVRQVRSENSSRLVFLTGVTRSRRCGGANARRRPYWNFVRWTSTSSGNTLAPHHDIEAALVMLDWRGCTQWACPRLSCT